jgi:serine protease Do
LLRQIGYPFSLDPFLSAGIIGGRSRSIPNNSSYTDVLLSDLFISPGNSGGPLLNLQQEVIGVCSAVLQQAPGIKGMSLIIPINLIKKELSLEGF